MEMAPISQITNCCIPSMYKSAQFSFVSPIKMITLDKTHTIYLGNVVYGSPNENTPISNKFASLPLLYTMMNKFYDSKQTCD